MTRFLSLLIRTAMVLTAAFGFSAVYAQCYHAASGFPQAFHSYYPMDVGAGDATGAAPGVAVGEAAFGFGCLLVDGVGDYVALPIPMSSVDGLSVVTVEAWVNRSPLVMPADTIYYEGTLGVASLSLAVNADGRLILTVRSVIAFPEVGVPTVFTSTRPVVPTGAWVHVAATIDLVAKVYVLYVDGAPVEAAGTDATTMAAFASAPTDVTIGTAIDDMGAPINEFGAGCIDEVTVFERALSRGEIAGIFEAGRDPITGKCRADADADLVLDTVDNCPVVANPAQVDGDFDGAGDACDVLPGFAGCFAAPERIHAFFDGPGALSWSAVNSFAGAAPIAYDVVLGTYPPKVAVGAGAEACLVDDLFALGLAVPAVPVGGMANWYLLRAENACGLGSYGVNSAGDLRMTPTCPR